MEKQTIEGYQWICTDCGKIIRSTSEAQQSFNIGVHNSICKKTAENLVKQTPVRNIYGKTK